MALFRRDSTTEIRAKNAERSSKLAVDEARDALRQARVDARRARTARREAQQAERIRRSEEKISRREAKTLRTRERGLGERVGQTAGGIVTRFRRTHTHVHSSAFHHVGTCGPSCRAGLAAHSHKVPNATENEE